MPRCPICANETAPRWRPFCSRRCADIDLARWMGGHYSVPGPALGDDEATERPAQSDDG